MSGFRWLRGWHRLPDENDATLVIESVNLETEANFTCLAYNEAGDGDPATTFIDVSGERHMSMRPKLQPAITELHSGISDASPNNDILELESNSDQFAHYIPYTLRRTHSD